MGCQREGVGDWVEPEEGPRGTKQQLGSAPGGVQHSMGDPVDNIVMTTSSAAWACGCLTTTLHT